MAKMITATDRLKTKLRVSNAVCVGFMVVLIIFMCLFIYQTQANKKVYQRLFDESLHNASSMMNDAANDNFDYERKYREITADIGFCCKISYLTDMNDSQQKLFNELYYAFIKLPNQVNLYFEDITTAINNIQSGDESLGYKQLKGVIDNLDTLDY